MVNHHVVSVKQYSDGHTPFYVVIMLVILKKQ